MPSTPDPTVHRPDDVDVELEHAEPLRSGVFERADGRFEWRIVAPNGRIVATSHVQGFENRGDAEDMFVTVAAGGYIGEVAKVLLMVEEPDHRRHLAMTLDRARRTPPPGRPA